MMLKKRGETKGLFLSRFIVILMISCVFIVVVEAQEVEIANDVTSVILVEAGDSIDNALASAVSRDLGIPVLYTKSEEMPREVITELQTGVYRNVQNVILLGGESVISDKAEESLRISGIVGGFDVIRIRGLTGTDTALNIINYFYGHVDTVTLVEPDVDIYLSAQLSKPIIPIEKDLSENVFDILNSTGVEYVNIMGLSEDSSLKQRLTDLNVKIKKEVYSEEIEEKLQDPSMYLLQRNNKILLVEKFTNPITIQGSFLVYYEDEDNDGIEDNSGLRLDEDFSLIYKKYKGYGVENVYFYSDDQRRLGEIENSLFKKNIPFEAVSYEDSKDLIQNSLELNKDFAKEINQNFVDNNLRIQEQFEEDREEFEKQLAFLIEQIKIFYRLQEDNLSPQAHITMYEALDSTNGLSARWKSAQVFINEYMS